MAQTERATPAGAARHSQIYDSTTNPPSKGPAAARFYAERGFRVLRMRSKSQPSVKGFDASNPEFTCEPDRFRANELVGMLCGPCPALGVDWLLCIDRDGPFTHDDLEAQLGALPATLTSHGGRHEWWRVPPSAKRDRLMQWNDVFGTKGETGGGADLRWAGGYACELGDWDGPFDAESIATLPDAALDRLLDSRERDVEATARDVGGPEWLRSRGFDPLQVLEWAAQYLEHRAPVAIQGNAGHDALLVTVGALLVGYGLDDETAMQLLVEVYNPRCEPPWESPELEKDFQHKIQTVNENGSRSFTLLQLAHEDRLAESFASDTPSSVKYAGNTSPANDTTVEKAAPERAFFRAVDWRAPLGEVPWLCRGLDLVQGRPSILVGKDGRGKSWAAQAIGVAVATGQDVFGKFPVQRPGRVVHLDIDQGGYLTSKRYQQLAARLRGSLAETPIEVLTTSHKLIEKAAYPALLALCTGAVLCVVDNLRNASNEDENSSIFAEPLRMMQMVSDATGCAFLVLHHEPKDIDDDADSTKVLRGTGAIPATAGSVLRVVRKPGSPARMSHIRGAGFQSLFPRFMLELTGGGEYDEGAALIWREADQNGAPRENNSQRVKHILQAVQANPSCTKDQVWRAVGGKKSDVMRDVEDLLLEGVRLWNYGTQKQYKLFTERAGDMVERALRTAKGAVPHSIATETRLPIKVVSDEFTVLKAAGKASEGKVNGADGWLWVGTR